MTELALKACSFRLNKPGDVLIAMYGATIGKVAILAEPAVTNQAVCGCSPFSGVFNRYLFVYLLSQRAHFHSASEGGAQPNISKVKIVNFPFPLPPFAEQKRIVAKVDELMALCDRLEAQQQERDAKKVALTRAALDRFSEEPSPANLGHLFHPSYDITPADLRKTILTMAVQGKLVPQDPGEEPARLLIARLLERKRDSGSKILPPITLNDIPFSVPDSWEWERLGNISVASDSGWSPQCLPEARTGTGWGVLKVSAVSWGVFKPEENKALPPGINPRFECEVKKGDFLLSRANTEELVARSVIVEETPPHLMMSDKIVRFDLPAEIDKEFINLANSSRWARSHYAVNSSGTSSSMKNISRQVMCDLAIPIPPRAEQKRIVAKVKVLMKLVDRLEAHQAAASATADKLLDAVVGEMAGVL